MAATNTIGKTQNIDNWFIEWDEIVQEKLKLSVFRLKTASLQAETLFLHPSKPENMTKDSIMRLIVSKNMSKCDDNINCDPSGKLSNKIQTLAYYKKKDRQSEFSHTLRRINDEDKKVDVTELQIINKEINKRSNKNKLATYEPKQMILKNGEEITVYGYTIPGSKNTTLIKNFFVESDSPETGVMILKDVDLYNAEESYKQSLDIRHILETRYNTVLTSDIRANIDRATADMNIGGFNDTTRGIVTAYPIVFIEQINRMKDDEKKLYRLLQNDLQGGFKSIYRDTGEEGVLSIIREITKKLENNGKTLSVQDFKFIKQHRFIFSAKISKIIESIYRDLNKPSTISFTRNSADILRLRGLKYRPLNKTAFTIKGKREKGVSITDGDLIFEEKFPEFFGKERDSVEEESPSNPFNVVFIQPPRSNVFIEGNLIFLENVLKNGTYTKHIKDAKIQQLEIPENITGLLSYLYSKEKYTYVDSANPQYTKNNDYRIQHYRQTLIFQGYKDTLDIILSQAHVERSINMYKRYTDVNKRLASRSPVESAILRCFIPILNGEDTSNLGIKTKLDGIMSSAHTMNYIIDNGWVLSPKGVRVIHQSSITFYGKAVTGGVNVMTKKEIDEYKKKMRDDLLEGMNISDKKISGDLLEDRNSSDKKISDDIEDTLEYDDSTEQEDSVNNSDDLDNDNEGVYDEWSDGSNE
jgi:hypothetical protein